MAFTYARGPKHETTGIPSSAFSRGHPLMYDSASSLSRIPATIATGTLIVGIALADSTESLNHQVPYMVIDRDTILWSDATTGSQMTPGETLDLEYTGGEFRVSTSVNTAIVKIADHGGTQDLADQSVASRVQVMFDPTYLLFKS